MNDENDGRESLESTPALLGILDLNKSQQLYAKFEDACFLLKSAKTVTEKKVSLILEIRGFPSFHSCLF